MINWVQKLINKYKQPNIEIDTTKGPGLADVYKNGKKTNTTMYLWSPERVDRLINIGKELQIERRENHEKYRKRSL